MCRIAVISDIHSNLQALEAVWARIAELSVDQVFCLGDIVGYGARPAECLGKIRSAGVRCVQGNHDALVADGNQNLDFNIYSLAAVEHNRPLLSDDDLQWLGGLPTSLRLDDDALFVHGAPDDRDRYLIYLDDPQDASARIEEEDGAGVCFFGHTHHPVVFDGHGFVPVRQKTIVLDEAHRVLVNPGSVGQPRDNDPRASFAWLDRRENVLTFGRVEYDILAARHDIIEAGLPRVLGDRLLEGR